MSSFFSFLDELPNLEKTRNFAKLGTYDLAPFWELVDGLKITSPASSLSVIGTNGKGSISHFLSQFLSRLFPESTVGLYTSPHLLTPNERIQIANKSVTNAELDNALQDIQSRLGKDSDKLYSFSYFEIFTLVAFCIFSKRKADYRILEAGLGGRLDATKVAQSETILLAKIGLDHQEILGNTPEKILLEKLHIATKTTKRLYSLPQEDTHLHTLIQDFCTERNISCKIYPMENSLDNLDYLDFNKGFVLWVLQDLLRQDFPDLLKKISVWKSDPPPPVPGRMEVLQTNPIWIYDPAHNPQAVGSLLRSISIRYPFQNWRAIFFSLPDKDGKTMLELLKNSPIVSEVFALSSPTELTNSFTQESSLPTLVLGSFRIYPQLKDLLQTNEN